MNSNRINKLHKHISNHMCPLVTNNFRFMMFPFYALAVKLQTEFSLIVPWKRVTSFAHIGKENHDSRKATDRNQAKSVSHFQ